MGESFATVKTVTNVTKKQWKFRKELELRLLKKYKEEKKKKLRNKLRNKKEKSDSSKGRTTRQHVFAPQPHIYPYELKL
jgi:hypothetical protein